MARFLLLICVSCGLFLAGCRSTEKNEADRQPASPTPKAQAQATALPDHPDHLTTGGIARNPESALPPAAKPRTEPPAPVPAPEEDPETTTKPVILPRLNILLTVDQNVDGNFVARFEGDFFPRMLRAMHADLTEIPPIALLDGKPAKYTVAAGRSQLVLQVRADGTANPQQVLVSYRLTLLRPSQSGSVFQREAENIVWKLGETRALMGKLPNAGEKR